MGNRGLQSGSHSIFLSFSEVISPAFDNLSPTKNREEPKTWLEERTFPLGGREPVPKGPVSEGDR